MTAPVFPCLLWSGYFWRVLVRYFVQFSSICVCLMFSHDWLGWYIWGEKPSAAICLSQYRQTSCRGRVEADLPSTALCRYCVLYKLKVCGNPHQAGLSEPFFQQHFLTLLSVSHFGNSCNILTFSLLLCVIRWSVIRDHWCYYYTCWSLRWWLEFL